MNVRHSQLPEGYIPKEGLMNLRQVLAVIPISSATWYARIKLGLYPRPVRHGARNYWKAQDIRNLLNELYGEK